MSRTNEKRTTLQEYEDVNVRVDYFWASKEDGLIPLDGGVALPGGWLHAKARIDLLEFTETFDNIDKTIDFKTLQLYINSEFIGELADVQEEDTARGKVIKCYVVVGAG